MNEMPDPIPGFDSVDLDMIRRGDMLGPRLGARVFEALSRSTPMGVTEAMVEAAVAELARWFPHTDRAHDKPGVIFRQGDSGPVEVERHATGRDQTEAFARHRMRAALEAALQSSSPTADVSTEPVGWRVRERGTDEWLYFHAGMEQAVRDTFDCVEEALEIEPLFTRSPGFSEALEAAAKVAEEAEREHSQYDDPHGLYWAGMETLANRIANRIRALPSDGRR